MTGIPSPIQTLHNFGARIVPLDENGWPMVRDFTDATVQPTLQPAPRYGLLPASMGQLVLEIESGDPQAIVVSWLAQTYRILDTGIPGRVQVFVRWDRRENGPLRNVRWARNGCVGEIRHRFGLVQIYDPAALGRVFAAENMPSKGGRVRQGVKALAKLQLDKGNNAKSQGGGLGDWNADEPQRNMLVQAMIAEPDREPDWRRAAALCGVADSEADRLIGLARSDPETVRARVPWRSGKANTATRLAALEADVASLRQSVVALTATATDLRNNK